jgi:hypothetical protein
MKHRLQVFHSYIYIEFYISLQFLIPLLGLLEIVIIPAFLPEFLERIISWIGVISLLSSLIFRFIQRLEGFFHSRNISKAFQSLRLQFKFGGGLTCLGRLEMAYNRNYSLHQVSFYALSLSIHLASSSYLTFIYLLYVCNREMDQSKTTQATPPPPVKYAEKKANGIFYLPIIDDIHSNQNIALYAFGIGCISGIGLSILLSGTSCYSFGFYLMSLGIFHILEYISTAMFREDVTLVAFLLNHSREYHMAVVACTIEYWIEFLLIPSMNLSLFFYIGIVSLLNDRRYRNSSCSNPPN